MCSRTVLVLIGLMVFSFTMLRTQFIVPVMGTPGTINVGPGQDYETIQAAVNAAGVGDTVLVASGTYHEHLIINKSLTLKGNSSDTTLIDGGGENQAILSIAASNVEVSGFTIQNGSQSAEYPYGGIQIMHNVSVTIRNNIIRTNYLGIFLSISNSCDIINNMIVGNYAFGIKVSESSYNRFVDNIIKGNPVGIWLTSSGSQSNRFYHNNFINNTSQVNVFFSPGNTWDNGYPSGGNYWSDHTVADLYSGPNQNEAGSDGIGDLPYPDEFSGWDKYPLKGSISIFDACTLDEATYYVKVISNSTVSDFNFSRDSKLVTFNVTGPNEEGGFCRVIVPHELLWCDTPEQWTVLVDDNSVIPTVIDDASYTYLYFTYVHYTKKVEIIGTHVIPEFPMSLLLLIFMIVTLIAMVFAKLRNRLDWALIQ